MEYVKKIHAQPPLHLRDNKNMIKISDIYVSDDGCGPSVLRLSGSDAIYFKIIDRVLYFMEDLGTSPRIYTASVTIENLAGTVIPITRSFSVDRRNCVTTTTTIPPSTTSPPVATTAPPLDPNCYGGIISPPFSNRPFYNPWSGCGVRWNGYTTPIMTHYNFNPSLIIYSTFATVVTFTVKFPDIYTYRFGGQIFFSHGLAFAYSTDPIKIIYDDRIIRSITGAQSPDFFTIDIETGSHDIAKTHYLTIEVPDITYRYLNLNFTGPQPYITRPEVWSQPNAVA